MFGMRARGVLGLERGWGDAGEFGRDGGVETDFCGEGESVVGSLRLRILWGRKGDRVMVVGGRGCWKEEMKGWSDVLFPCMFLWIFVGREVEGAFIGTDDRV